MRIPQGQPSVLPSSAAPSTSVRLGLYRDSGSPKQPEEKPKAKGSRGLEEIFAEAIKKQGGEKPAQGSTPSRAGSGSSLDEVMANAARDNGPQDDTVAIIDDFQQRSSWGGYPGGKKETPHGQMVRNVVEKSGVAPTDIRQIQDPGVAISPMDPVNKFIEGLATGVLESTSDALQGVLDKPGRINVVNSSRGVTKSEIVGTLWNDRKMRGAAFNEELGVAKDASDKQVLEALTRRVDDVFAKSEKLRAAQERYAKVDAELEKRGILHVAATGNDRERTPALLDKLGVKYGEDFTRSVLATDKTINVGASTGGKPDAVAPFSNGGKHVSLVMDGTDVDVGKDEPKVHGTSFSAPQVTGVVADIRKLAPKLTNEQVRDILKRASKDTGAPDTLDGAGVLDPQKARELAQQWMLQSARTIKP